MTFTDINARFEPEIDASSEQAQRRAHLAQQMAAVRRRSKRIRTLRTLFPAAIVLLIVLNCGWITIQSIINSLNIYGASGDEFRVANPRYIGQTGSGDNYIISGLEAVRKGRDSQIVTLKSPILDLRGDADTATHVTATVGVYNQTTQIFVLTGHVVMVSGPSQFTLTTEQAYIDMVKSTMYGDKHVEGNDSMGHIEGESFLVSDKGGTINMEGRGDTQVHGVIYNNNK